MNPDIFTLKIILSFTCVTLFMIMESFSWWTEKFKGFRLISLSYLCVGIGVGLWATIGFSNPLWPLLTTKVFISTGFLCLFLGIQRYLDQKLKFVFFGVAIVAVHAGVAVYLICNPRHFPFLNLTGLFYLVQLGMAVWALLRDNPYKQLVSKYAVVGPVFFLLVVLFAKAVFYLVFGPSMARELGQDFLDAWLAFVSIQVVIATSLGFMWMNVQRMDIELAAHVKKVEAGYKLVDAIFNTVPIPVFHKDLSGRFKKVNKACLRILGLNKSQVLGMTIDQMSSAEDIAMVESKDQQVVENGENLEYENRVLFDDGLYHDVIVNKGAIKDRHGRVVGLVGTMTDITERKIYEAKIRHLAMFDQITGLYNRNMFYSQMAKSLASAKRNEFKVAIIYLDLDEFKPINDRYGHQTGDKLLKAVGRRLLNLVRKSDYVCRVGGDEFVVLIEMYEKREDLEIVADKIRKSLAEPFELTGMTCNISVSIGIAQFPENADDVDRLVYLADKAMYAAKSRGKNMYSFCNVKSEEKSNA